MATEEINDASRLVARALHILKEIDLPMPEYSNENQAIGDSVSLLTDALEKLVNKI
jgi:hypothetical protein